MLKTKALTASLAFLIALFCGAAQATTVTLTLKSVSNNNGSVYTYPYMFSVNGSSDYIALMCDDYKDDVQLNETWTASVNTVAEAGTNNFMNIAAGDDPALTYQTAAYLLYQAISSGTNPAYTSYNEEVWQLMGGPNFGFTSTQLAAAKTAAAAQSASFYDQFIFYTYQETDGYPSGPNSPYHVPAQEYIGFHAITVPENNGNPVPEPGSMLLFATGLSGISAIMRKRKN